MPEYLSPGVYVEEVDTGSKPIEGVSTSTSGMVGVTERGPENVPILVTSFADFLREFGGYLDDNQYPGVWYLPHAVQGFFTNVGKRLFAVRVLDVAATRAMTFLFDGGTAAGAMTQLLRSVAGNFPDIYLAHNAGVAVDTWLQIGEGAEAEYRQVNALGQANEVPLSLPIAYAHAATRVVNRLNPAPAPNGAARDLTVNVAPRDRQITVTNAATLNAGALLRIGVVDNDDEYVFTASVSGSVVTLRQPLMLSHPAAAGVVQLMDSGTPVDPTSLDREVSAGDTFLFIPAADRSNYITSGDFVHITDGNNSEIRRIGQLAAITLSVGAYADYPASATVEAVTLTDDPGSTNKTTEEAQAGANVIVLDDRQGLNSGDVVRIGMAGTNEVEYVTIQSVPNRMPPPDSGNVILTSPLQHDHIAGTEVWRQLTPVVRTSPPAPTALTLTTRRNSTTLILSAGNGYVQRTLVRINTPVGVYYHRVESANPTLLTPVPVNLDHLLSLPHLAATPVIARTPLLRIEALDRGAWGNRLRVTVQDQNPPLLRTNIRTILDSTHIRLDSVSGVETGTLLQRIDANGQPVGAVFKVVNIDRQQNYLLTLASPGVPAGSAVGDRVRSLEFQMNVILLRQPDPSVPTRSEMVLDSESYPNLSMDPRHSRYIEKVIGTSWNPGASEDNARPPRPLRLEDRRSEGESWYVRIYDIGKDATGINEPDATLQSIRFGPEPLVDILPDGRRLPARRTLTGGDDSVTTITDDTYRGQDAVNPRERTGLFALKNIEEISIVAVPGRTSQRIQEALINHCELMRYRFAVLDSRAGNGIAGMQEHRGLYDTKYAALYYPWLKIPDPFPENPQAIGTVLIPPSGHVMGIYARSDIERGVHKAPANEVIRGISDLEVKLMKEQQDMLNPRNINVLRNFRENNRGLRVWGVRTLSSDPDWKYINVRRLFIFVEHSIDKNTQWVVFEPNDYALWERVKRVVSAFLTQVWRDGALMGKTKEEAFFVKCDRTTMTQADIDNGRLIMLIGIAPVKPAEFVIFRIGQWVGGSFVEEG